MDKPAMFTPVSTRAASAYKRVGVETAVDGASPHHLIRLLFDALLNALRRARGAMQQGDIQTKGEEIVKAVRILEEGLKASLDEERGGELAANLNAVYTYCVRCLTLANLKNDAAALDEALALIEPVADAWKQISDTDEARGGGSK